MGTNATTLPAPYNVVDLQKFKGNRPMSQGSPRAAEDEGMRHGGDRESDITTTAVTNWIQRIMLGLVALLSTIATAYFSWSIPAINNIGTTVQLFVQEQTYTKQAISSLSESNAEIKRSVDSLTLQSNTWATKDDLSVTKESFRHRIDAMQADLNELKIKLTRMEAESSKSTRR